MALGFDEIRALSGDATPISDEQVASIRRKYPFLPYEYLSLLAEVGRGEVCGLTFYSGPIELSDVFDEATVKDSPRIVLVADDLAGGHLGYCQVNGHWALVFFDHTDLPTADLEPESSLADFLTWWSSDN